MVDWQCLVHTPALTVYYAAAQQCLYVAWRGVHTEVSVRENGVLLLPCVRTRRCTGILSDHTQLLGDWRSAAEWVGTVMLPRLAHHGVRRLAWVPARAFDDRVAMCWAAAAGAELHVSIQESVPEALTWLQAPPDSPL